MSITTEQTLPEDIVTERLRLRAFSFSDVPDMFAYLQEPEMGRYLEGSTTPPTEDKIATIIARHILADRTDRGVWAITIENRVVGGASINFSKEHRVAEIGYSVKKPLWGQGYASEASKAVIDAAFDTYPDLQRIQANIHPENSGSIRVAERVGMQYEGTLRSFSFVAGEIVDEVVYAVLRSR